MNDTEAEDKQNRQAALRRLQPELFALEGDRGQLERKRNEAVLEVKRLDTAISRLETEKQQAQATVAKLERDIELANDEIGRTKRKIDTL